MINYKEIKEKFDSVIRYSQSLSEDQPLYTNDIFDEWLANKAYFRNLFRDKLIYEYPEKVIFHLSEKERQERIQRFVDMITLSYGYDELCDFIKEQKEGFFKNLTVSDYRTEDGAIITKGTRFVKAFKYFIRNERSLTDIQNHASRLIQEDKIEGTLCLSIHPLDYLSLSENTHNWRSCHALDGEYRAGNLSYMMDKSTVVCYLKTSDSCYLPNFPSTVKWNSKKWRVLLYFSQDNNMIFAGKPYPFMSMAGMDIILKNVLPDVGLIDNTSDYVWSNWTQVISSNYMIDNKDVWLDYSYAPIGRELLKLPEFVKDASWSCHYNDVLRSTSYTPYYSVKTRVPKWGDKKTVMLNTSLEHTKFYIGHKVFCVKCGEKAVPPGDESMLCEDCKYEGEDDRYTCEYCGCRLYEDEVGYIDDLIACRDCIEHYTEDCYRCGEHTHRDNIIFDENEEDYLCRWCYDQLYGEKEED